MPKIKKINAEAPRPTYRVLTLRVPREESKMVDELISREIDRTHRYFSANRLLLKLVSEAYARLR